MGELAAPRLTDDSSRAQVGRRSTVLRRRAVPKKASTTRYPPVKICTTDSQEPYRMRWLYRSGDEIGCNSPLCSSIQLVTSPLSRRIGSSTVTPFFELPISGTS